MYLLVIKLLSSSISFLLIELKLYQNLKLPQTNRMFFFSIFSVHLLFSRHGLNAVLDTTIPQFRHALKICLNVYIVCVFCKQEVQSQCDIFCQGGANED